MGTEFMRVALKLMHKHRVLAGRLFAHLGFQGFAMLCPMLLLPVVTRLVPPADYGLYALVMAMVQFIYPVMSLGIEQVVATTYMRRSKEERAALIGGYLVILAGAYVILQCIALVVVQYLPVPELPFGVVFILVLLPALMCIVNMYQVVAMMQKRLWVQGTYIIGRVTLAYMVNIPLLLWAGADWRALLIGQLFALALLAIGGFVQLYRKGMLRLVVRRMAVHDLMKVGAPLIPYILLVNLVFLVERSIIARFLGSHSVGVYAVTYTVMSGVTLGFIAMSRVSAPWIMERLAEATDESREAVVKLMYALWTGIVLAFAFFALVSPFIMHLLTSKDYSVEASSVAPIMAIAMMFSTMFTFSLSFLTYEKRSWLVIGLAVVGAVLNISLDWILVPVLSVEGAATAALVANMTVFGLCYMLLMRVTPLPWNNGFRLLITEVRRRVHYA